TPRPAPPGATPPLRAQRPKQGARRAPPSPPPPMTDPTFPNSCGGLPHDAQIRSLPPQGPTRRSSPVRSYGHADKNAPRRELASKPRLQWRAWFLSDNTRVADDVAAVVIAHPSVTGA